MKKLVLKSVFMLMIAIVFLGCSSDSDSEPTPTEPTKTKVKITSYQINGIPFTAPDGLGWDGINGNPDIYIGMYNNENLVYVSGTLNDVPPTGLPIGESFLAPYYLVPNFSDNINFIIMDDDGTGADDLIGNVNFVMSNYTTGSNKYPSSVVKSNNGVIISLNLIWE
jgi:hypothetical protein